MLPQRVSDEYNFGCHFLLCPGCRRHTPDPPGKHGGCCLDSPHNGLHSDQLQALLDSGPLKSTGGNKQNKQCCLDLHHKQNMPRADSEYTTVKIQTNHTLRHSHAVTAKYRQITHSVINSNAATVKYTDKPHTQT